VTTEATTTRVSLDRLDRRHEKLRLVRPDVLAAVRRSVALHGLLHPLIVNGIDDGVLVLLDGFKRLTAIEEQGAEDVLVRVVHLSEVASQAAMLTYNDGRRGGMAELEEAWVVRSLVRGQKLQQKRVAELLGRHKTWVCRRLTLAEYLAKPVEDDMRLGLINATIARELVRLPRGNQACVAQVVRDHGLTSRQTARLVELYLGAESADAVEALLADPLRALATVTQHKDKAANQPASVDAAVDPRLSATGAQLARQLRRFDRAAVSVYEATLAARALKPQEFSLLAPDARAAVAHGEQAQTKLRSLVNTVDAEGGKHA
jgi:ParB-like chromosome segregation protein Spo0J